MRILLHDYSGHPFQAQLSRGLSRRGHEIVHSYCDAYTSGKGQLEAGPDESLEFAPIGVGVQITKLRFRRRLVQEIRFGLELISQTRSVRPEVTIASNVPIPTLVPFALYCWLRRIPWVLWHQDVQSVAISSFAGKQLSRAFVAVALLIGMAERWCARRAAAVVVIADSFVEVHRSWGTSTKTTVIPNWAPLDEIRPVERRNAWSSEHGLDEVPTLLYSGTLGLKHNPALLVSLADAVRRAGAPVHLVVVNEGPAEELLRAEAERLDVPLLLLPFQPYERLSEVLGSGDLLVVLLESDAGAFSVPSKSLSYLCAARPIVGLMPSENLASALVSKAGGLVLPPDGEALGAAADWITEVLGDADRHQRLSGCARALAEDEFNLDRCLDAFEGVLAVASTQPPANGGRNSTLDPGATSTSSSPLAGRSPISTEQQPSTSRNF